MRPPLPRTKQHCSVKSEFGYFAGGCFAQPKALPQPAGASDRQFDCQHEVQEVGGIGEEVVQES